MDTAIITGAGRGIGLATARILGSEHHVVLADVRAQELESAVAQLTEDGVRARAVGVDVSDPRAVAHLMEESSRFAHEGGGRVRAVVHAAGVSPQMGSAQDMYRVNAVGTVNVTRAFLATAGTGDALVNVASIAGHWSPQWLLPTRTFALALRDPQRFARKIPQASNLLPPKLRPGAAYATSKAFVIWYTAHMAASFGAKGARIVSVSPGMVNTDMGRLEIASGSARVVEFSSLGRPGEPREVASVLAFAAGTEPEYLTGADILVDGGAHAGMKPTDFLKVATGA